MAKLGEARLGSTQFATPAAFEIDTFDARRRAEENMKNPFPTHEGTVWDQILSVILLEFEIQNEVIDDIVDQRFIDDATMYQIGMIADMWGVERRAGESDELFRARVKNQIPRHTSSTTIDQILESSANLLQTDKSRLQVDEHHEPLTLLEFDDEEIPDEWYDMWAWFKHTEGLESGWTTTEQETWMNDTILITVPDGFFTWTDQEQIDWINAQYWDETAPSDWDTRTDTEKQNWLDPRLIELPDNWSDDSQWSYLARDSWVRDTWLGWVDPHYSGLPTDWGTYSDEEQLQWMREEWIAFMREDLITEPARFDLAVEDIVLHDAGVSIEDFEHLLQDIKAAGVRVVATIGDQFTYRSIDDDADGINNPDKGYGGYDHQTILWPDVDDPNAGYSHDEYGDVYGSPAYLYEPGQVTEDSELLDIGGGYADEITSQL